MTSLDRALEILELASQRPGGLTNADIHRVLRIPKSSCSYVLARLERTGYLRRSTSSRRYELGLKVLTLAHGALRDMGLRATAEPVLHELADQTGCSGLIGVLQQGRVVIVDKVDQPSLATVDFEIGVLLPAHATALGKVLLASLSHTELNRFLGKHKLTKKTARTLDTRKDLIEELDAIRRRGFSTSDGELFPGMRGLAAAIRDPAGEVCAGLSLVGNEIPLDDPEVAKAVRRAAMLISKRLEKAASSRRSLDSGIHALSAMRSV